MKSVSIITTREDVKRNIKFYKIWIAIFILLIIVSPFTNKAASNFFFCALSLFLASIGLYVNKKYLKPKDKIVSKTITDINNIKNALLVDKIMLIFYLVIMGIFIISGIIARSDDVIGILFFFIFVLSVLYKKIKITSSYTKNK